MPVSNNDALATLLMIIEHLRLKSILDVGAGFGKYGVLFRELLDVRHVGTEKRQWTHRIDAVEVWENPYERHRSHWQDADFAAFSNRLAIRTARQQVFLLARPGVALAVLQARLNPQLQLIRASLLQTLGETLTARLAKCAKATWLCGRRLFRKRH